MQKKNHIPVLLLSNYLHFWILFSDLWAFYLCHYDLDFGKTWPLQWVMQRSHISVIDRTIKLKLPVLLGPLLAIQPFSHPLIFDLPGHWATLRYIRNKCSGLPGLTISLSVLCAANVKAPSNILLAETQPSQSTNSHLGRIEPRRLISCAVKNSC